MRARLFLPDYWPSWIGVGCLRIIAWLPDSMIVRVGHSIGWLARQLPLRYLLVARRNIGLCLPKLSGAEREQLIARHFQSLGMCLCEAAMCWWSSDEDIRKRAQVEGVEHLQAALAAGRGVILLTAHFTTLEIGARILNATLPINVLYKPPGNEVLAAIAHRRRHGQARRAIRRDDVRTMVRALRDNEVVWYAPDQSYRKKGARMVNFFGIPAATNTFTPRLAQMTGAAVLFFSHERLPSGLGWKVVIHPALKDFPTGDEIADTERYHAFIESEVRRIPEQYWWIHRRFKGLSPDYPNYYAKEAPVARPAIRPGPI